MKRLFLPLVILIMLSFFACHSNNSSSTTTTSDSTQVVDSAKVDTTVTKVKTDSAKKDSAKQAQIRKENAALTKPKVPQMSFCDCVRKQDTLKKQMMNANSAAELKAIQQKIKKLVNGPCQKVFATTQVTAQEVAARKAKVAACLGK